MLIKDWLRQKLEKEYLGKKIKAQFGADFVVTSISVEYGGVDPQWEIDWCGDAQNFKELFRVTLPVDKMPEIIIEQSSEPEMPNEDLSNCEQCNEPAWDGRICHSCGMKDI